VRVDATRVAPPSRRRDERDAEEDHDPVPVRLDADRDSEAFLAWSRTVPEIWDAVHVTGPSDYMLHVRVRDTQILNRLLRLLKAEGGAIQTQTRLALR